MSSSSWKNSKFPGYDPHRDSEGCYLDEKAGDEVIRFFEEYLTLKSKPIARLMEYLRRVKRAQHSTCMQYARLNANQMKQAVETLVQRGNVRVERKEVERKGSGKVPVNFYVWIE